MRFFPGQNVGQSGYELLLSVFFSFFLHAAAIVLVLIFAMTVAPKSYLPPFYEVKLVGPPAVIAPASSPPRAKTEPAPAEKRAEPKVKVAAAKPPSPVLKKGDMPELETRKAKPEKNERAQPAKAEKVKPAATEQSKPAPKATASVPGVSDLPAVKQAAVSEGVGQVSPTASGDAQQLVSYSQIIHDSIERNWNPPPGAKGMRAKVSFKVLRTGRLYGDVNIEESSGNAYFDMAAKRVILASSPFPPMPEEFYKQYAEFSVDVQEKN